MRRWSDGDFVKRFWRRKGGSFGGVVGVVVVMMEKEEEEDEGRELEEFEWLLLWWR